MIQTYEGALTETDSILQRMKTLADQAANGTYQDDVDRDAIQLEFDQLNDELNQIADTDFNGVVVLNGGEMADGTKAVDGKFDYSNKADQVAAANSEKLLALQAEAQSAIDAATKKVAAAQKKLNGTKIDMSNNGAATEWNTVDNNGYGKAQAAQIFGTVSATPGFPTNGIQNKDGDANLADLGATSVSITFEYDKDADTWTAIDASAIDKNGDAIEIDLASVATAAATTNASANASANANTGLGGFSVDGTNANAIFDATAAKTGDTVTLVFTNNASETVAPNNIGMDADSLDKTSAKGVTDDPTIAIHADLTDTAMTQEVADALKTLNNSNFSIDYASGVGSLLDENDVAVSGFSVSAATANAADPTKNDYTISYKLSDGTSINLATVTAQAITTKSTGTVTAPTLAAASTGDGSETVYSDGSTGWVDGDGNAVTSVTLGGVTATLPTPTTGDFNKGDALTLKSTDGSTAVTASYERVPSSSGTVSFGIAVDAFNFSTDGGYTVKAGKNENINSDDVVATQKALEKAKAELKAAQEAYPTKLPDGVSKADAYNQATAPLTYTDHVMLQSGARTKDLVDFTFKYSSGGLGDLKANMNCSAREDGLNTANLSLKNQKDANYAIDRIDNAINKVSMVRATFGAVQNRLEHKIDNMNVTKENLTSAESRIRDTNMAEEMTNFTKNQILSQASQAMLAQANQLPQGVLQLLG